MDKKHTVSNFAIDCEIMNKYLKLYFAAGLKPIRQVVDHGKSGNFVILF